MPVVRIDLWKGRNQEQKRKLIKGVTDAVVDSVGCPPEAVQIIISDFDKSDWGLGGLPASEKHPDK